MQEQSSPVRAVIDIGSNTIHLVVARCSPDTLDILADEVALVRIGESVTATGDISQLKQDATLAVLRQYRALAEQYSASPIFVVATEAIRQARNGGTFLTNIQHEIGLTTHLLSGMAEATLTFYGTTYDRGYLPFVGVIDLGGGSTELIISEDGQIRWQDSVPIGSGWLLDRYLSSDPPTQDELSAAHLFLHTCFQAIPLKHRPPQLIVTGGSANSLLQLAQHALGMHKHGDRLTHEMLAFCKDMLWTMTADDIAHQYELSTTRVRILSAGTLVIQAIMERFDVDEICVSPHGIREGVLLAYERYGEHWLEHAE